MAIRKHKVSAAVARPVSRYGYYQPRPAPKRVEKPKSFTRSHMIELPLAAALVDRLGAGADDASGTLSNKREITHQEIIDLVGDARILGVYNKKLVLSAIMNLSPQVTWMSGELRVKDMVIPETVLQALIGQSVSKLVEHPWLPDTMIIKTITLEKPANNAAEYYRVTFVTNHPTFRFAFRTLRGA